MDGSLLLGSEGVGAVRVGFRGIGSLLLAGGGAGGSDACGGINGLGGGGAAPGVIGATLQSFGSKLNPKHLEVDQSPRHTSASWHRLR